MNNILTLAGAIAGSSAFTVLISGLLNRRKNKVDETAIIAEISAQLRKELFEKYEERGRTISKLRRTIIFLTNLLDKMIPRITGLAAHEIEMLKDAVVETRLAGLAAEI